MKKENRKRVRVSEAQTDRLAMERYNRTPCDADRVFIEPINKGGVIVERYNETRQKFTADRGWVSI